ncbi:MAG: 6,7-dimethyl-8-ribityllumazine synthase [Chlamydiia bacterium]|nr:6,7-dimethyl-8-ribityllumazine synthase [Chlamydiia bacterium]
MHSFKGKLQAPSNSRVAIVCGQFNELITDSLLKGALDGFDRCGLDRESIDIIWVPGAFEIPSITRKLAQSGCYQGVLCLGAVIRGATTHYDYVAGGAASGIASVAADTGIPCVFEVLTTENIEQALERAGTKAGNKGRDGALALIEMLSLHVQLSAHFETMSRTAFVH